MRHLLTAGLGNTRRVQGLPPDAQRWFSKQNPPPPVWNAVFCNCQVESVLAVTLPVLMCTKHHHEAWSAFLE